MMRFNIGKKGGYHLTIEQLLIVARLALVLLVSVVIVLIVANYINREVNVDEAQSFVVASRLLNEDCLGYHDGTRVKYGVLDGVKINEDQIVECMVYDPNVFAAKINLGGQEFFYNEETYLKNYLLCDKDKKKHCGATNLYVLIQTEEGLGPASLNVEVVALE